MDKSYFETRKAEIQFEIDNWKQKMKGIKVMAYSRKDAIKRLKHLK